MITQIILMVVFTVIAIVIGFVFTYFLVLSKGKKMIKQQTVFDEDQAKSMYLSYRGKEPNEKQIKAMILAFKNNK
ncbi:MAG: hypothetical protein Ta2E_04910 [Mycoplasmoidaceae bacterium]|nr:MAG: hypothetical protein Ta2E_04910 [Mycoplasmoidaceae bacterium]